MERYVVAGNPVEHSQSPFIHAEFARQTGEAVDYGRHRVALGGFDAAMNALAACGVKGCNVTVPFKFEAAAFASTLTPRAALAGAVNVLRFDAGGAHGDNTDGIGLVRDIERHAGVALVGLRVLLIGAGGAAAGALGAMLAARPAEVVVANRTLDKARALVARHEAVADASQVLRAAAANHCGTRFDVVINATSTSLHGAPLALDATVFGPGCLAIDMMYGPAARVFLDRAEAHGARGRDGLGMLVEQAAEAFEIWRGVRPDGAPVLAALRLRLAAAAPRAPA